MRFKEFAYFKHKYELNKLVSRKKKFLKKGNTHFPEKQNILGYETSTNLIGIMPSY